jgi:ABC-type multidrug transport system permease subunit
MLRLALPPDFTQRVLDGPPVDVDLAYTGQDIFFDFHRVRVGRVVHSILGDLIVLSKTHRAPGPDDFAGLAARPAKLVVRTETAGRPKRIILGFQQSVPGFIVMFTLMVSFNAGAVLLVAERRLGLLRRLASTPISIGSVVTGKLLSRVALGAIQVACAMLTGKYAFGVFWGGSEFWAVLLLLAVYIVWCAAVALLGGTLVRTESHALAIGIISANLLAALGGCWWPIEITPPWMQQLALLLPTGWAMNGLHKLLSYGDPPASILPHLAAFLVTGALAGWLAARRFRFE